MSSLFFQSLVFYFMSSSALMLVVYKPAVIVLFDLIYPLKVPFGHVDGIENAIYLPGDILNKLGCI